MITDVGRYIDKCIDIIGVILPPNYDKFRSNFWKNFKNNYQSVRHHLENYIRINRKYANKKN